LRVSKINLKEARKFEKRRREEEEEDEEKQDEASRLREAIKLLYQWRVGRGANRGEEEEEEEEIIRRSKP